MKKDIALLILLILLWTLIVGCTNTASAAPAQSKNIVFVDRYDGNDNSTIYVYEDKAHDNVIYIHWNSNRGYDGFQVVKGIQGGGK